jgi:hypothetical protein
MRFWGYYTESGGWPEYVFEREVMGLSGWDIEKKEKEKLFYVRKTSIL